MLDWVRAAISVAALAAFACTGQAAILRIPQGTAWAAGPMVSSIAADDHGSPPSSYYQLIMDPWSEPTRFRTFATEPLGNTASSNVHPDDDAPARMGHTGPRPPEWSHKEVPARDVAPLHAHLLGAGPHVLEIGNAGPAGPASPAARQLSAVPLPGAMWLLVTSLLAFIGIAGRHKL
jgi:hypothetical protein